MDFRREVLRCGTAAFVLLTSVGVAVLAPGALAAAPSNDDFANAQTISGPMPLVVRGTGTEATVEPGEPYFGDSIWYAWTAPKTRQIAIETCGGQSYPPVPHVYTGSALASLTKVRSRHVQNRRASCPLPDPSHDDPQDTYEVVEFDAVAGTTYRLQVVQSGGGALAIVLREPELYDLAVSQSVSRRSVPAGGTVTEILKVTNRGNIAAPTPQAPRLAFGQELNVPWNEHYPGKAVYAFTKSPGGRCSHGTYGPTSKVQTFACNVIHLDPGESQVARVKIKKIKGNLLLDAGGVFDDYRRDNDEAQVIVRVRR